MDRAQKIIVAALIATSALAWLASIQQPDMMLAMTSYNPLAISLFTASWTAGMAAMMFPAITPMVLLYNRFVMSKQKEEGKGSVPSSVLIQEDSKPGSLLPTISNRPLRVMLFVGSYLLVWALVGIALLFGWSIVMNNTVMMMTTTTMTTTATGAAAPTGSPSSPLFITGIYGSLLIIAGVYQFTPLKRTCIGYCESPISFFMRRWKDGTSGAVKMGVWHGMYCLGCCWSYFLLMVALGWMNLLWMGLFAGVIFGEKIWSRGIWVARAAGIGLAITGVLVISGMLPSLVPTSNPSMIMDQNSAHNNNDNSNSNSNSNSDNGSMDKMSLDSHASNHTISPGPVMEQHA